MAIAIRMAMINTTTINSMRVKPSSASFRRATNERTAFTGLPSCVVPVDHLLWFAVAEIGASEISTRGVAT